MYLAIEKIEKLGFDNWFWESSARSPLDIPSGKDKVDSSKTPDIKIARVISVNKNSFVEFNPYQKHNVEYLINKQQLYIASISSEMLQ